MFKKYKSTNNQGDESDFLKKDWPVPFCWCAYVRFGLCWHQRKKTDKGKPSTEQTGENRFKSFLLKT